MKQFNYFKYLTFVFALLTLSCSNSKNEEGPIGKNEVKELSFSWDFIDDAPYNRTYDLAFINDVSFEFSATAHGTTGNQFGLILGDYIQSDDEVIFSYSGRGFQAGDTYVKPISGILKRDKNNKITEINLTLRFEKFDGKVSTSELLFYISDYKPTNKDLEEDSDTNLSEKDLLGTVWEITDLSQTSELVILCKDHTTFNIGQSWSYDKKNQVLKIQGESNVYEYKILSGNKGGI